MNIPDRVRVGPQWYEVEYDPARCASEHVYGEIQYANLKIVLDNSRPYGRQCQTLIHEIVHGLSKEYDIGLKEHQVALLEVILYQLILDNPMLFEVHGDA